MRTTINAFDIKVGDRIAQIDGVKFEKFDIEITRATPLVVKGKHIAHQVEAAHG